MRAVFCAFLLAATCNAWPQDVTVPVEARLFAAIDAGKEIYAEGLLLNGKPDLNVRNSTGETILHRAVGKGMKELVQLLIKAGASVRARSANGETVLHAAALHAEPEMMSLLLAAGADPKARNDDGESPLHWAALSGHAAVAAVLIDRGADPDVADLRGYRPLHSAADSSSVDTVRLVLSRCADPGAKSRDGRSAEDVARERGNPQIVQLLAEAAARGARPAGASAGSNYGTVDIDKQPKQGF